MNHRTLLQLLLALALLPACDGSGSAAEDDGGIDGGSDTDSDSDTDTDSDSNTATDTCGDEESWVGTACDLLDLSDPCTCISGVDEAFCFSWAGALGGICTRECEPASFENPVDGCQMDGVVCMDISHLTPDPVDDEVGYGLCVEECIPEPLGQQGPCKADYIRCDPHSWAVESQMATCLLPKCQTDADCIVATGPFCLDDDDCSIYSGETCSSDGFCVFEADCDPMSGRCTWGGGDQFSIPGEPCESLWDCNSNMICLRPIPFFESGFPQNGYCTKMGCNVLQTTDDPEVSGEFGCGDSGVCVSGYSSGGLCFGKCDPSHDQPELRCRQQFWYTDFKDEPGYYDCYDQTGQGYPIWATGNVEEFPVADSPYCTWPSGCALTEFTAEDCLETFGGDWDLDMTCRDPESGLPAVTGYCLDSTTSGQTEAW